MRRRTRSLVLIALLGLTLARAAWPAYVGGQGAAGDVDSLLARMTPAERVGQLFLVGFSPDHLAEVADLVQAYRIGGVVLAARHGNLSPVAGNASALRDLVASLQNIALGGAANPPATATPTTTPAAAAGEGTPSPVRVTEAVVLPLFVAISSADMALLHDGTNPYHTASMMTLGATWNPSAAERAGRLAGAQLRAIGVNVLLGPPLDVANPARAGLPGDLGTDTFGESPYWVSVMGRAYVRGVHAGSEGRVLSIGTHFPGLGVADRDVYTEIPVIQDSLENRLATDVLPFVALARPVSPEADDVLDGMLTTHVQFHSINASTQMARPASLDPQALYFFLSQPSVDEWRSNGGLLISDSLGARSVRLYYDPKGEGFQAKRAAYDAFLAGNDVLMLDMVGPKMGDWEEHFAGVRETLEFFQAKYQSDAAFRGRVDDSVRRILAAKLRLYPRFAVEAVVPGADLPLTTGQAAQDASAIAAQAVTIIYPRPEELAAKMPAPPGVGDRVVIVEEVAARGACEGCEAAEQPPSGTTLRVLQRLYGQEGSGHVDMARVLSFTFDDLAGMLAGSADEGPTRLREAMAEADWVLFVTQGARSLGGESANPLAALLRQKAALLRDKRVVVFALGAPYSLDSTDMAKVSVYYGLYSATEWAIEAGLRALFGEISPVGKSPVSVAAVGYRLPERLQPASDQMLYVEPVGGEGSGTNGGQVSLGLGDELTLTTGVILDRNGKPVPDGTAVTFLFSDAESRLSWQETAKTTDGKARVRLKLERTGTIEVSVAAGQATQSAKLLVSVRGDQPAVISTLVPTPTPTATPQPTPVPVFPGEALPSPMPSRPLDFYAFLLSVAGVLGLSTALGALTYARAGRMLAVETTLVAFCAGLTGYLAYGLAGLASGRDVLLESMPTAIPWRWQPAVLSWLLCGATGLVGWARPSAMARAAQALRRALGDRGGLESERDQQRSQQEQAR